MITITITTDGIVAQSHRGLIMTTIIVGIITTGLTTTLGTNMDIEHRLEALKIAREIVMSDYTNRRADLHNQWLFESDNLWKTQRVRLSYPSIPPYPTETEIVERAKLMIDFVEHVQPVVQPEPMVELVESPPPELSWWGRFIWMFR